MNVMDRGIEKETLKMETESNPMGGHGQTIKEKKAAVMKHAAHAIK